MVRKNSIRRNNNRRRNIKRSNKRQRGAGYSFGVDLPQIRGMSEVVSYSDCATGSAPTPQDHSVANLVGSNNASNNSAAQNVDLSNNSVVETALNAPAVTSQEYTNNQTGGKRRRKRKSLRKKSNKRKSLRKKNSKRQRRRRN